MPALPPDAGAPPSQVGPGMFVSVGYAVFDGDDEPVGTPHDVLDVVFGYGQLLPELEVAIAGLPAGAERSVSLRPGLAFGLRRKEAIVEFDREEFPADVAPGDRFEAENADGALIVLKVLEVLEDAVVIDTNHPLAGQKVRFELRVRSVRPATAAELAEAERRLLAEESPPDAAGLISPSRLLRRPSHDYESPALPPGQRAASDGVSR